MLNMFSQLWSMLTTFITGCHEYMCAFEDSGKYVHNLSNKSVLTQEIEIGDELHQLRAEVAVRAAARLPAPVVA